MRAAERIRLFSLLQLARAGLVSLKVLGKKYSSRRTAENLPCSYSQNRYKL